METQGITLSSLEIDLSVCKLDLDALVPAWAISGNFYSLTRRTNELSLVCESNYVPKDVRAEDGWRALEVVGSLDFGMTGVIAKLSKVLADAGIPIFVISTFDTDVMLVKEGRFADACYSLQEAGYTFG